MRNTNINILSAVDTSTQTGAAIDANQLIAASFMASYGDSAVAGSLNIQVSNDIPKGAAAPGQTFVPTNWVTVATSTFTAGTTQVIATLPNATVPTMAFRWLRAVSTVTTAGSSTVSVNMNALGM